MLKTVIRKNSYQDSINLMLLTNAINGLEGVKKCSIMMGTDANKDIFKNSGLLTEEAKTASPSDMVIVIDAENEDIFENALSESEKFLADLAVKGEKNGFDIVNSFKGALDKLPEANLALVSIPGEYGVGEIENALDQGLHVFSFTDNIPLEEEARLKRKAHEQGIMLMGADCGTGIISSTPLAFTNVVKPGNIGIVGASGTGIQEVTTIIDRLGGGVVHAIGTGGRDLSEEVGAITAKDALLGLEAHEPTDVIVFISKPPAKKVRDEIVELLHSLSKPAVAIFLGEKPDHHEGDVYLAHTLEEAARIAVDLAEGKVVKASYNQPLAHNVDTVLPEDKTVKGLYSGGTLAAEAGMLMSDALDLGGLIKEEGYILKANGYEVMDLGDDIYTKGKPHPMIDPEVRIEKIRTYANDADTGVILFDCVLGYGAHKDMAAALSPAILEAKLTAEKAGRTLHFVATVCGTAQDPQGYDKAIHTLEQCGVFVEESNAKAVRLALKLKGIDYETSQKEQRDAKVVKTPLPKLSDASRDLFNTKPRVVNIGLKSFTDSIIEHGGQAVQYNWKPAAGGNKKLIKILHALAKLEEVEEGNQAVVEQMKNTQPFLIDVRPAKNVIDVLNDRVILHAGPPIDFKDMTGPMQGSCIGAVLFEGWAEDEQSARTLLESGGVTFSPCHHHHAVGPMGGITSGNMPVLVVENKLDGSPAYCTLNEGIGKVLRFGAYSQEVVDRLHWMKDVLGPVLSEALKYKEGGINLNVMIAKAITMGDEFHQRNIAASLNFLKEITPLIVQLKINEKDKFDVISFLADTDQFFLNIMMAAGKATVDAARKIQKGTVVTTMARNGRDFGVRISGMGDEWYTAPVNTPNGLYFTGYSERDANPDIGDSAITETVGVGGMAMIAAPGVTRFVGAGGFTDALDVSEEMDEICLANNANWSIPTWDFKGACLGIDAQKVIQSGITPIINTGIAHKEPGIGQVGAGTVRAPLACFEKALLAYADKLGIAVD
ncbi:acyl-CoA synthetase FdrA [Halolactibacillus alkaliphilus]|uniref:Acyl-CoA synthetase FdrA n=2 Tax=Halolactibacillus alkaliphilus TaxID=442899 RepID=A0A511WYK5_9BACI|nr:acyl-CoA synthetase FdrA [Halolactibacillus alkaliphilus]GGN63815.1 acyl-CoA synthetase FdrA [Halolactibacillus alkaliphilus]SFO62390.1 Succinyl-CoA synthetase, alpha subunit [Halolactibacillus alkaliphilus]